MTDYEVEYRLVDKLQPYPKNARVHSEDQIRQIIESIQTFGFTNPVLCDEFIRAGHGRARAAARMYAMGMTLRTPGGREIPSGMVPVIDCSRWSEDEKKAYVLVDNRIALNASWDDDLLRMEVSDLQSADVYLTKLGFSESEIENLFKPAVESEKKQKKEKSSVIQFNIVFDDVEQQQAWFAFIRQLKGVFPDDETLGKRLSKFISQIDMDAI